MLTACLFAVTSCDENQYGPAGHVPDQEQEDDGKSETAPKMKRIRRYMPRGRYQLGDSDGEDLCYMNVSIVDNDGNPVPADSRSVKVKVSGTDEGDITVEVSGKGVKKAVITIRAEKTE